MTKGRSLDLRKQKGFTLLELMIVMLILGVVLGAVFTNMDQAQQRMTTEETKLDDFQLARDFVDQFFRDINQIGDPNYKLMDVSSTFWSPALSTPANHSWTNPYVNDHRFAMGLVKIDTTSIQFEGSVNGIGSVQEIIYQINGSGTCTLCLQRSQINKVDGDPLTGQNSANWGTEVNDVIGTPIYRYFLYDGTEITGSSSPCALPADYTTSACATTLANVKTIQIKLRIQNPNITDPKTGQPIETSFEGEVALNNCSMAALGQALSCN